MSVSLALQKLAMISSHLVKALRSRPRAALFTPIQQERKHFQRSIVVRLCPSLSCSGGGI